MRSGFYEISNTLLTYGAWAEQPSPSRKWTAVHEAARQGHADVLTLLLRSGGGCVDQRDATGATPLHVAVEHSQLHAAEILLLCGQSVSQGLVYCSGYAHLNCLAAAASKQYKSQIKNESKIPHSQKVVGLILGLSALILWILQHPLKFPKLHVRRITNYSCNVVISCSVVLQ